MTTANRFLELPTDAPRRGFTLRYGFQRGMLLVYRSHVAIYRSSSSVHGAGVQHEELEATLRVKILDIDEADNGARLIVYHEPVFHRIGPRNLATAERSIVYTKQNEYGEVIESTTPNGGVNLMLPRMPVSVGSSWREIERFVPPSGHEAVELVRNWSVESGAGSEIVLRSKTDALDYQVETDEGLLDCTAGGKGEYTFDTQWGVVSRQSVETTITSRSSDLWFEVQRIHDMELMDEG